MSTHDSRTYDRLLKRFRKEKGLSQAALAERAQIGLSSVQAYENRRRLPKADAVDKLSHALGLTAEEQADLEAAIRRARIQTEGDDGELVTGSAQIRPDLASITPGNGAIEMELPSELASGLGHQAHEYSDEDIVQWAIVAELARLPLGKKELLPSRDQAGIIVKLKEHEIWFTAQPMVPREGGFGPDSALVDRWLNAPFLVIPMWWNDSQREILWASLPELLFETNSLHDYESIMPNLRSPLRHLSAREGESVDAFFRWVQVWCKAWPLLREQQRASPWLFQPEFPIPFLDLLRHPSVSLLLPMSRELVHILDELPNDRELDRHIVHGAVLNAGKLALKSPERGASMLTDRFVGANGNLEIRMRILEQLKLWVQKVPADQKQELANTLRALSQLNSLLSYRQPGDLQLPPFVSQNTFQLGKLISLLPTDIVFAPLVEALVKDTDPEVLRHSAYYLGILNLPGNTDTSRLTREIRQRLLSRRQDIGDGSNWQLVDRQMLFCAAQLGSDEARDLYLKALRQDKEVLQFEAAYHYGYYSGNPELIKRNLDHRLDERRKSDQFVREILGITYQHMRKMLSEDPTSLANPDSQLWQVG